MIELRILLFGITREIVGQPTISLSMPEGSRVIELREHLLRQYPGLGQLRSLAIAVNEEYASPEVVLHTHNEVALIPPVSGG